MFNKASNVHCPSKYIIIICLVLVTYPLPGHPCGFGREPEGEDPKVGTRMDNGFKKTKKNSKVLLFAY